MGILLLINRHQWFIGDDWDFVVDRGLHHPQLGIFQPHNEHWSTLPILLWRPIHCLVGLKFYLPYLVPMLVAHITLGHLLWRLSLRAGAASWIATAGVGTFLFLGAGAENLLWAFQLGFVGSVAFGSAGLLLMSGAAADNRRVGVRQAASWVVLILGLMSSGLGVTMVVVVGLAVLMLQGIRAALVAISVPAAVYLIWYWRIGSAAVESNKLGVNVDSAPQLPQYIVTGISRSLEGWTSLRGGGGALFLGLLIFACLRVKDIRGPASVAFAGVAGVVVLFTLTGVGRLALGVDAAAAGRYVYAAVALLVPVACLALTDLQRFGKSPTPVLPALLVGIAVAGVSGLIIAARQEQQREDPVRRRVLAAAELIRAGMPLTEQAVDSTSPNLTVPLLAQLVRERRLPAAVPAAADVLEAASQLQVALRDDDPGLPPLSVTAAARLTRVGVGGDIGCSLYRVVAPDGQVELQAGRVGGALRIVTPGPSSITVFLRRPGSPGVSAGRQLALPDDSSWLVTTGSDVSLVVTLPLGDTRLCVRRPAT